tara:strand:- start:1027 stop:1761 length:735 start_codon:yes stop_codon:yes gene_type:complete
MANVKITDLTLLASGSITNTTDVLPIVNVGGNVTNKTTVSDLKGAMVGGAGECSIIVGGDLNTTIVGCSFIGGGNNNIINNTHRSGSVIVGGQNNTTTSGISGPNYQNTFIGGGKGNTISGYGLAFLGGGQNNTVSGGYNNVIVGGGSNTNSGYNAFIGGGANNTNSSNYGGISGGKNNTLSHEDSFIIGSNIISSTTCTTHVNNLTVSGSAAGTSVVIMRGLPTSDPGVTGQLYNDGGTLKIS